MADLPTLSGLIAAAFAITALVGWVTQQDELKAMLPGAPNMKPNTAICFLSLGTALVLLSRKDGVAWHRTVGLVLVATASAIALATGVEYLTGTSFRIDELLFADAPGHPGTVLPGRMSPVTAISLLTLAVAAVAAASGRRAGALVSALCGLVLAIAALNVFNFAFGGGIPAFLAGYTQIAINSAIAMGVLAIGVLGLLDAANPLLLLTGRSPAAQLLRRLVIVSLAAPLILTWLRLAGQRLGLFDAGYGASIMVVALMSLSLVAILRSARLTKESDDARATLEVERDRFFELSLDLLSVTGLDGRFERVNRAWETTFGYTRDELIGTRAVDLVHPDDLERTLDIARRHHLEGESLVGFHNRFRHRDGSYRWLEWMSRTAPDGVLSFGVARDITERKSEEDRRQRTQRALELRNLALSERSVRDPLTGLHNRRFFDEAIVQLERRWSRGTTGRHGSASIILFDLDHFGQVNKQYGHQAGDAVLRQFGAILGKRFREGDLIARYGGEEFVAILEGTRATDATRIAESIRARFEATAIDIGAETPIHVTVSAGCAELGEGDSVTAGLAIADVWLSQAKRAGRNQVIGASSVAVPGNGRSRTSGRTADRI